MRLRLDLSYDGTDFHGWARQPALRTVQGELEGALAQILRVESVPVTCAGRTDTGVHARGQVVHLDVSDEVLAAARGRSTTGAEQELLRRLNGVLSEDIRILRSRRAPAGFDARFAAIWRRYAYRIADAPELVDPLGRRHVLAWPRTLDLESMNQAATLLLGRHDFAAFCRRREGATTIRTLLDLSWARDARGLAVATVRSDAFCHNMVRSLVGCLIPVGEGKRPSEWSGEILARRVRDARVTVVPGRGLTLEQVAYPPDEEHAERAALARNIRTLEPKDG